MGFSINCQVAQESHSPGHQVINIQPLVLTVDLPVPCEPAPASLAHMMRVPGEHYLRQIPHRQERELLRNLRNPEVLVVRHNCERLHINKLDYLKEMDKFLDAYNIPGLRHRKSEQTNKEQEDWLTNQKHLRKKNKQNRWFPSSILPSV